MEWEVMDLDLDEPAGFEARRQTQGRGVQRKTLVRLGLPFPKGHLEQPMSRWTLV